jgi:Protein of unknown function (DUF4199)
MNKNAIYKHSLVFGISIALVSFGFFLMLYWLGYTPLGNKKLPDIGFNIILTAGAIWMYKRKNNGYIHTWEAISIGYLSNLIAIFISAILIFLFLKFIDQNVLNQYIKEMVLLIEKSKEEHIKTFNEASYNSLLAKIKLTTMSDIFWDEIVKKSIFLVIPIFIMSAVFRKIPPRENEV